MMDIKEKTEDTPLTIAAVQAFRKMLYIIEEFAVNTEAERLADADKDLKKQQ